MTTTPVRITVSADDHSTEAERRRQSECPARRHGTCQRINDSLGYPIGLGLRLCDQCHASGPDSEAAETFRRSVVNDAIRCNIAGFRNHNAAVRDATLLHMDSNLAMRLIASCDNLPSAERDRMVDVVRGRIPPASTPAGSLEADRDNWEAAERWTQTQRAASLLRSILSRVLDGRAPSEIRAQRHRSCFGDDDTPACPNLRRSTRTEQHYCTACGCGDKPWARLDAPPRIKWWQRGFLRPYSKLDYPTLNCPRRRAGFSNARPTDEPDRHHRRR